MCVNVYSSSLSSESIIYLKKTPHLRPPKIKIDKPRINFLYTKPYIIEYNLSGEALSKREKYLPALHLSPRRDTRYASLITVRKHKRIKLTHRALTRPYRHTHTHIVVTHLESLSICAHLYVYYIYKPYRSREIRRYVPIRVGIYTLSPRARASENRLLLFSLVTHDFSAFQLGCSRGQELRG